MLNFFIIMLSTRKLKVLVLSYSTLNALRVWTYDLVVFTARFLGLDVGFDCTVDSCYLEVEGNL